MPEGARVGWGWEDSGLPPDSPGTILTVGTFDGVHRGHQDVLAKIARRAEATGLLSVLVTFDPHPLEVVAPDRAPRLLTVGQEKLEVVAESGIHYLAVVPFTRALQQYSATQFVDEVLRRRFHMSELVIGYDHHFGRGREGSPEMLRELGERRGFAVDIVRAVTTGTDDQPVSSSAIRRAVAAGDLEGAALGLGRPYSVSGRVVHGEKRGRLLGYPTINLSDPPPRKLLPPFGVYAVRAHTPAGTFGGMMSLGPRPTFDDPRPTLETNLFDTDADLYGAHVKLDLLARLRDIERYSNVSELIEQLGRDAEAAKRVLGRALTPGGVSL